MGESVTNQDILGLVESLDKLGGKIPKEMGKWESRGFQTPMNSESLGALLNTKG